MSFIWNIEMRTKIAVATSFGKAYYLLVSELKKRRIPFITTNPGEALPLNIEVTITTESEKDGIHCPTILIYDGKTNPSKTIEKAYQIIRGKHKYKNIIVGIDPGKDFGIAVIGDRAVLETKTVNGEETAVMEVLRIIDRFEADQKVVKIGNGGDEYQLKFFKSLNKKLPLDVDIESVDEGGTTGSINNIFGQRIFRDASSAIKISMRRGCKKTRKK